MTMSERHRKEIEKALVEADPKLIEKFGNPLDENDPRHWLPTERGERGLSVNDRVRLLELDMELVQETLGNVIAWVAQKQKEEMLKQFEAELKEDPKKAIEKLLGGIPSARGAAGDTGPAYAGSTKGLNPSDTVETPNGVIRADQIPGYRNDPNWTPSPDWADANCMCPVHVAQRKASENDPRFGDGPTGMYL
jgi:hypothetical protein